MNVKTITRTQLRDLVEILQPDDLRWLKNMLDQLLDDQLFDLNAGSQSESPLWDDDDDEPLPESATLDEAIKLYLADKCSLGRAAELADVTRWDIQRTLKERGIPIVIETDLTVEEMDQLSEELEREGLLCSL